MKNDYTQVIAEFRRARTALLLELDRLWMRAQDENDQEAIAAIAAQRQKLRDFPEALRAEAEAGASVEDMRSLDPFEKR